MFFIASKLFWAVAAPGNLLLLLLALGAARLLLSHGRRGAGLVAAVALAFAAIAVLPLGQWLLRPLEAQFPPTPLPAHVDGIILLGGAVEPEAPRPGQAELNSAAMRVFETLALARRYPAAKL